MCQICQKWYFWQTSNGFPTKAPTLFWHIYKIWHNHNAFPNIIWHSSDWYLYLTVFWQNYDIFKIVFWHIFETDSFLTDIQQIYELLGTNICLLFIFDFKDREVIGHVLIRFCSLRTQLNFAWAIKLSEYILLSFFVYYVCYWCVKCVINNPSFWTDRSQ